MTPKETQLAFESITEADIPELTWDSSYEEFLELAHTLRGVAFRPK